MQKVYIASTKPICDSEVLIIQRQLNTIKRVLLHDLPIVKEDGLYGMETEKAVRAFQRACNISSDGRFGPQTYNCMMQKLREVPSIGPAPSRLSFVAAPGNSSGLATSQFSIGPAPVHLKGSSLASNIKKIVELAGDVIIAMANNLNTASEEAAKQLANLQLKYQNYEKISQADIQNVMNSMWQKPSVKKIREDVEREVMDRIRALSRGNTNRINYKNDWRTIVDVRKISIAQQQVAKGPNIQTVSLINKTVARQVVDKCAEELRSVQFDKKISQGIGKVTKGAKSGGGVLKAITFIPLVIHFGELVYNIITQNPIEQNLRDIAADIVEIVVGFFIALAISALVGIVGITGGLAVLAVVVIGIIVGLLLSFFFDDGDISWSKRIVNWTFDTFKEISSSINSKKTLLIDFQRTGRLDYWA